MNKAVIVLFIFLFIPIIGGAAKKVMVIDKNIHKGLLISSDKIFELGYKPEDFDVGVNLDDNEYIYSYYQSEQDLESIRGNMSGKVRIEIRLDLNMRILSHNYVR